MTNYVGDKPTGARIDGKFTTVDSNGVATALSGGTLTVFAGASTVGTTQGAFLISSFSSITGLNHFTVSTSVSAGFYTANQTFQGVLTAGTVGSSSVVGYVVCEFSLEHGAALRPTVSGRTLDVTATGAAGVDWANVESQTTVVALSQTTISTGQTVSSVTAGVTVTTNNDKTGYSLTAGERSSIGTATWGSTRIANSNAGTFGEAISGVINPVTVGTNNDKNGYALTVVGASGVWDVVNVEHSAAGTTGGNLLQAANAAGATSSQIATAVWSATRIANSTAGTFGEAVSGAINVTNVTGNVAGSVGSVTGNVGGNVVGSVDSVTQGVTVTTNNDKTGYTLTSGAYSSAATAVLLLDWNTISTTATTNRNLLQAARPIRNRIDTATISGTMIVYKEDDTTTAWTAVLSSDSTAEPITQIDPA